MDLSAITVLVSLVCLSNCDFFDNLNKMDLDSQLLEIDKMMKTIDKDEDEAMGKIKEQDDKNDDVDIGEALDALTSLLGKGECIYKCKNGKPVN